MRRLVAALAIVLSTAAAAHAQSLAGDFLELDFFR